MFNKSRAGSHVHSREGAHVRRAGVGAERGRRARACCASKHTPHSSGSMQHGVSNWQAAGTVGMRAGEETRQWGLPTCRLRRQSGPPGAAAAGARRMTSGRPLQAGHRTGVVPMAWVLPWPSSADKAQDRGGAKLHGCYHNTCHLAPAHECTQAGAGRALCTSLQTATPPAACSMRAGAGTPALGRSSASRGSNSKPFLPTNDLNHEP